MKKSFLNYVVGGALFLSAPVFTSCQDILGEWDKPAPVNTTPSTPAATGDTYRVYTSGTAYTDEAIPSGATKLTGTIAATAITEGTYVISGTATCTGTIAPTGDVVIILEDDATFTITGNISETTPSSTLKIYGQANGTGQINITTTGDAPSIFVKDMEVHGGKITAKGDGAESCVEPTGTLTIYHGTIYATNTGSSNGMMLTSLNFYGGEVKAVGVNNGISYYPGGAGDYIFNYSGATINVATDDGSDNWTSGSALTNNSGRTCAAKGIWLPVTIA